MEIAALNSKGVETGKELYQKQYLVSSQKIMLSIHVKAYLAAQRQGTHKAKERAEIVGLLVSLKTKRYCTAFLVLSSHLFSEVVDVSSTTPKRLPST